MNGCPALIAVILGEKARAIIQSLRPLGYAQASGRAVSRFAAALFGPTEVGPFRFEVRCGSMRALRERIVSLRTALRSDVKPGLFRFVELTRDLVRRRWFAAAIANGPPFAMNCGGWATIGVRGGLELDAA